MEREKINFVDMRNYQSVYNKKGEHLGNIEWNRKRKKWTWSQDEDVIMSAVCLQDVIYVMVNLRRKNER